MKGTFVFVGGMGELMGPGTAAFGTLGEYSVERFTNGTRADCLLLDPAGQIGIEVDSGEDHDGQEGVLLDPRNWTRLSGRDTHEVGPAPGKLSTGFQVRTLNGLVTLFGTERFS